MKTNFHKLGYCAGLLALLLGSASCEKSTTSQQSHGQEAVQQIKSPDFQADSAYRFVAEQVALGPRVPNTPAHEKGADYIVGKLKEYGVQVQEQTFQATAYDGKKLNARNIIGSINPGASKRVLLAAHWDTRHVSDQDAPAVHHKAIDGANDGASGAGVLLELARAIQASPDKPQVGIDLLFFDVEDYGRPDFEDVSLISDGEDSGYCLGSKYWSKNKHVPGYSAYFGILLDMVGGKNATFLKEYGSMQFAPSIVRQVWSTGQRLGYGNYFVDKEGPGITDDHVYVSRDGKIPMIDIIDLDQTGERTFNHTWHTQKDNMDNIDKNTLKAVGQTVMQVLYEVQ